jgi:hypothetical protein
VKCTPFVLLALLVYVPSSLWASQGTIIEVSRALRMSSQDPLPPKDFTLDMGSHEGVKVGDLLEVSREFVVVNAISQAPDHPMRVILGEMKIIAVGEFNSIGRMESQRSLEEIPALDPTGFSLGDQVRTKSGFPFR